MTEDKLFAWAARKLKEQGHDVETVHWIEVTQKGGLEAGCRCGQCREPYSVGLEVGYKDTEGKWNHQEIFGDEMDTEWFVKFIDEVNSES